ncbi:uncharacterized protein LOC124282263 [Haliotis rubra]|uniref:uncharacterized protein LOC124282263 n=1 Tax=Haliotis rubra TaxID=36100 RepID=UPI001EE50F47|nr:uncharacterized protein LOC124282263 [Haliotis rubra]
MDSIAGCVVHPLVLLLLQTLHHSASELVCPSVGYLGSPANLTCISPSDVTSYGYTTSQGEVAAICNVPGSSCTSVGDYMASTINQTHSLLTIPAVQPAHVGEWRCHNSPCNLTVVKEPSCFLTYAANSSSRCDGGDLMAHVIGYYCSERVHLKLVSEGSDTELANETVHETKNITVQILVTSTPSNLVFTCGGYIRTIPCSCNKETVRTEREKKDGILNLQTFLIAGIFVSGFVITLIILTCVLVKRRTLKAGSEMQCSNTNSASAPPGDASGEPSDVHVWGVEGGGLGALDALPTAMEQEHHSPAMNIELSTFGLYSSDTTLLDDDFDYDGDDGDDDDDDDEFDVI